MITVNGKLMDMKAFQLLNFFHKDNSYESCDHLFTNGRRNNFIQISGRMLKMLTVNGELMDNESIST